MKRQILEVKKQWFDTPKSVNGGQEVTKVEYKEVKSWYKSKKIIDHFRCYYSVFFHLETEPNPYFSQALLKS
ncbi:MAG: hypothetical protein AAF443_05725 [Chlamydiota bacterium]